MKMHHNQHYKRVVLLGYVQMYELKYSKDHEWLRVEGNTAYVGIFVIFNFF